MTAQIIKQVMFHEHKLDIIEYDGDVWFIGKQLPPVLGYLDKRNGVKDIFRRHKTGLEEHSRLVKPVVGRGVNYASHAVLRMTRIYNETGIMIITAITTQPNAIEFYNWAVKVFSECRKVEILPSLPPRPGQAEALLVEKINQLRDENTALKDEMLELQRYKIGILEGAKS